MEDFLKKCVRLSVIAAFALGTGTAMAAEGCECNPDYDFEYCRDNPEDPMCDCNCDTAFVASAQSASYNAVINAQQAMFNHLDDRRSALQEASGVEGGSPSQGSWSGWFSPYYRHSHRHNMEADGSTTKNDAGGGSFGADFVWGDMVIGAGFDKGYTKSKYYYRDVYAENESEFYGISMYGDWSRDKLRLYGGIGFSLDEHDLKVENSGVKLDDADYDTYALTTAFICEYSVYDKEVYVTPYAGLRYAFISTENYKFNNLRYDSDNQDIFRFPVGLKVGRNFRYSGGFFIRPQCNVCIEPVCGERNATTKIHSRSLGTRETAQARMTDDLYWDTSIGVTAGIYGISFTLAYDFHGSSHEKEHGVVFSYNWCF